MRAKSARGRSASMPATVVLLGLTMLACHSASHTRYQNQSDAWERSGGVVAIEADDDRSFAGASVLDRRELIRLVLDRNPNVRAARHGWRAALARYPQATALDDPMLGVGVAPLSFGSTTVNSAPKIDLSQKLPFPGKLRFRGEAALGEAEAASHDYEAVRLRLATMASVLFDDYVLAARSLEINREHVALLEEFQRIATIRYEAGEASQQDPLQAEVRLAHAVHREVVLDTAMRITGEQLNALLHRAPTAALPPPPAVAATPEDPIAPAAELLEQSLAARPELAAAEARVSAESSRVDAARREYYPDFTLVGSYNRVMQEPDLQPFVGVMLNVPLQIGRRRAAVDEAQARLEQARSQRVAIEDDVRFGVQSGADRYSEAHHVLELYRDRMLPAARDQVDAARAGFESGRNSFLALIDAERNLLDVELGHAEALANLSRRRAELDRAVGRIPGLSW